MQMELYFLIAIVVTNAAQFWFWSRQNHVLVDKIMSRNYAEYVQVNASSSPMSVVVPKEEPVSDDHVLEELNAHFGFN